MEKAKALRISQLDILLLENALEVMQRRQQYFRGGFSGLALQTLDHKHWENTSAGSMIPLWELSQDPEGGVQSSPASVRIRQEFRRMSFHQLRVHIRAAARSATLDAGMYDPVRRLQGHA